MSATVQRPVSIESAGDFDRAALEALGVEYEVDDDFPLTDIDVPGSRQVWQQVRPGEPLDEENIEHLQAVVDNGGSPPPPILYKDNRGKWRVISGNHRTEMYRRTGRTRARVYIANGLEGLKFENGAVLALAFEANAGHGKRVSEAYRLKQALDLVQKGGYEIRDAARALSVPEGKLRDEKEKAEATRRLENLGVDTEPIPVTARRRIVSIRSDALAKQLGELVPLMDQKVTTVEETVKAVNAARSDTEGAEILESLAATLRAAGGRPATDQDQRHGGSKGSAVSPVLTQLNRVLTTVINLNVDEIGTAGTTADYRQLTLEKIQNALGRLNEVKKAL
jgi:hypothetical protein